MMNKKRRSVIILQNGNVLVLILWKTLVKQVSFLKLIIASNGNFMYGGETYCLDCWMLTWVWSQFYPEDISAGMLQLGLPEAARIKCIKISILWTLQHTTQLRVIDDPTAPLAYQIFYSIQPGVPLILLHDCRNTPAPLLLQFVFFARQLSTINYWEAGSVRYNPLTPKSV